MKTSVYYLLVLLCAATVVLPMFLHAQELPDISTSEPVSIVEQIYETPEFLPLIDLEQAKVTLQDLAMSLQQMQVDYKQVDEKRSYLEERFGEMTASIEKTIDATEKNKELIGATLTRIALLESNITTLKVELKKLKADLRLGREQVTSYLLFLYQSYQWFYGTTDTFSMWKQFLWGRVIDVGLTAQQFAEMLTNSLEWQLAEIQERQKTYVLKSKELNAARIGYHQAAKTLQKDLLRLEEQKQYLYAQLRALQTDKATLDQQAAAMRRTQEDLAADLAKVKKMTLEWQGSTSAQVALLLELPDRSVGRNYFTRPILPPKYIHTTYGEVVSDPFSESSQLADYIRFELPQGDLIYASAPGLVHTVADGGMDSASQVVLLHKQWLVTVYTPMEEIFVQPGDVVRRGQIIWTVGGQPWTRGAWPESITPHLDFYVFFNAESKNPYEYLDLSVMDKEQTPAEWQQKRLDDQYARDVPLQHLNKVEGETVAERRDAFLRYYAFWPYADAALWYDAAEGQGVDPLMGICVGFAETSFKNFKTPNNIGNVGNNDRGDEVEYVSPIVGARALYSVLNNKYLWGYHTLNELSRFWNNDSFIYASSPYNRQRNVMRCLSSIYWYPIPEDFPFRRPK
jgi:murein DD-endopeptidase MepM/ murein hydrolase activator NlpD